MDALHCIAHPLTNAHSLPNLKLMWPPVTQIPYILQQLYFNRHN